MRFESSFGGKEEGGGGWGDLIYFQTFCDLDNSSFPCFFMVIPLLLEFKNVL